MEFVPSDDADLSGIYQDHDLGGMALENRPRGRRRRKKARRAALRAARQQTRGQMYSRAGQRMAQRQAARQARKAARQAARQERRALRIQKRIGKGVELGGRAQRRRFPGAQAAASQQRPDWMAQGAPPIGREFRPRRRMRRLGGPGTRPPKSGLPEYLTPQGQASLDLPQIAYETEQSLPQTSMEFTEIADYSGSIGVDHYGVAISNSVALINAGMQKPPRRVRKSIAHKRKIAAKKAKHGKRDKRTPEELAKAYESCMATHGKDHPKCKRLLHLHHKATAGKKRR